ncbi:MAG: trypsin-like peptidase domain-containing protein [Acidimicrobiales bacterium]
MTTRPRDRRAPARFAAAVLVFALIAGACADDTESTADTPTEPSGVPDDHGLSDATLARVLRSTVGIDGVACGRRASGSGFALTDHLVVTDAHVIVGIDENQVHTFDGRALAGIPVAFDPVADLAILDVSGAALAPLPLSDDAEPGSTGVVVGWESGPPGPDPTPYRVERRVTVRIEAVGTDERVERPAWLVAADIEVGDSGAALIDPTGEVIGVAFATSTQGEGVGYAVRSSAIEELLAAGLDANLTIPPC